MKKCTLVSAFLRRGYFAVSFRSFAMATALAGCLLSHRPANASQILVVDATGILIGARGVEVLGTTWDAAFIDGAVFEVFGTPAQLDARNEAESAAFSLALSLALLDTADGAFDSNPNLTRGCETSVARAGCAMFTPYFLDDEHSISTLFDNRDPFPSEPTLTVDRVLLNAPIDYDRDFRLTAHATWVDWTLTGPAPGPPLSVPEPPNLGLLAAALFAFLLVKK